MLADGNIIEQFRFENTNVTFGTEVVDVGDMSCQGLLVYFTGEKGHSVCKNTFAADKDSVTAA